MRISKLVLLLGALALTGAGCFGSGKSTGNDGGVFKTVDGGTAFSQQTAILSSKGVGTIGNANVNALAMDPEDNKTLYAGTVSNGLIYSLDGAASWQQARESGLREGSVSSVAVDPTDVCTVYVAKSQHLYKTDDCLRTFNADAYVETRNGVSIARVAVDWYDAKIVWIGMTNGDVLKSDDGAVTWQTSVNGKEPVTSIQIDNADSRVVLVGTDGAGFWRTADSGATWTQIKDGLKDFRNAAKVTALSQTKDGTVVLAASAYGILRSKDFGVTWEGLQLLTSAGQVSIRAIAVDPNNADTIAYAAGSTFYRSTDGGAKWTTSKVSTTRTPTVLLADPTDPEVLYLAVMTTEK
ncbi:hypothetical protein EBS80_02015 [bacterium]|nr:hypothetical protein [bacterium]